jgi:hypothetical protein
MLALKARLALQFERAIFLTEIVSRSVVARHLQDSQRAGSQRHGQSPRLRVAARLMMMAFRDCDCSRRDANSRKENVRDGPRRRRVELTAATDRPDRPSSCTCHRTRRERVINSFRLDTNGCGCPARAFRTIATTRTLVALARGMPAFTRGLARRSIGATGYTICAMPFVTTGCVFMQFHPADGIRLSSSSGVVEPSTL